MRPYSFSTKTNSCFILKIFEKTFFGSVSFRNFYFVKRYPLAFIADFGLRKGSFETSPKNRKNCCRKFDLFPVRENVVSESYAYTLRYFCNWEIDEIFKTVSLVFSRRFSREKCPTLTVASFFVFFSFFFRQTTISLWLGHFSYNRNYYNY